MSNNQLNRTIGRDPDSVTIRAARAGDANALERLADLDSARRLVGPSLLAVLSGTPVAAHSLEENRSIADPFRPTAAIVALLEARAGAMRGHQRRSPSTHELATRVAPGV